MHSPLVERALRTAANAHRSQLRKGCDVPYITHPFAVAMILQHAGFEDVELLAAALLHDVVEDTEVSLEDLRRQFPERVCDIVAAMSEQKLDAQGQKRPWRVRKEEHLAHYRHASPEVLALALADKLHNLSTMLIDLDGGPDVWKRFSAPPEDLLWYYRAVADAANAHTGADARLETLAKEVRRLAAAIEARV
jgi:(p)ppGpp synthase/HD superfamily hydrolase